MIINIERKYLCFFYISNLRSTKLWW